MQLYRVDYTLVGLISNNCMKLIPQTNSKFSQKVVVGDREGVTSIFYVKRGEIHYTFKSLPSIGPITNLVLAGSLGTTQDKVFISSGNEVHGFTKKGKMFLNFESELLENIKNMYVSGSDLLITGTHCFQHYHDCKLTHTYTCGDVINDIIALNPLKVHRLVVFLACSDYAIRVIDGSMVLQSLFLSSQPTCLCLFNEDGGENGDQVLVGTQDGQVHLLQVPRVGSIITKWIIENVKNRGEITCMHCFAISKNGDKDILIGRQDGNVEVYVMQPDDIPGQINVPQEKFSYACNESITGLQGGYVGNLNYEEIVVTTYTGRLFGLTTQLPDHNISYDHIDPSFTFSNDEKHKITKLRMEIEELELMVAKEREKYVAITQEDSPGVSRLPLFVVNDKLILQANDASHLLTIETETNIDNVLIQSDVEVKFLEVDKNSAVVSYSKCDSASGNAILATYRCQLNTTRLELKFLTKYGDKGLLQVYITPLTQPKCCQLRKYQIKPLSLYKRTQNLNDERALNRLSLKGKFSLNEMHATLTQCLPGVPEKPPNENEVTYTFQCVLTRTFLQCTYRRGEVEFNSDNISTISIIKDILSKEATKKALKLEISSSVNEDSITATLALLHPIVNDYYQLQKKKSLLEALKEISSMQTEFVNGCLEAQYQEILDNEQQINNKLNENPFYLERLYDVITNLYIDWNKFKGINVKSKLAVFTESLRNNYDYEQICSFFK